MLLDWRRRVADMYSGVRANLPTDAPAAHALWRSTRDELFRAHPQSPLPPSERGTFGGLPYYGYDPRYSYKPSPYPNGGHCDVSSHSYPQYCVWKDGP